MSRLGFLWQQLEVALIANAEATSSSFATCNCFLFQMAFASSVYSLLIARFHRVHQFLHPDTDKVHA